MGLCVKAAKKWPGGIIPYRFNAKPEVPEEFRALVLKVMRRWEAQIGDGLVQFVPWVENEHPKYVLLRPGGPESSSDIGAPTGGSKEAKLSVGTAGGFIRCMPHELGHLMGLAHENDRNIRFYKQPDANPQTVVYSADHGPRLYRVYPEDQNKQYFAQAGLDMAARKYNQEYDTFGEYDLFSIMHYPEMDGQFKFDCTDTELAQYCEHNGWPGLTKKTLNSPTASDVENDAWRASPGDINTIRWLYRLDPQVEGA